MPAIVELSSLSVPELRRLLKVARDRREGILADSVEWEIAARAVTGGGRSATTSETARPPRLRAIGATIRALLIVVAAGIAVGALATAVVAWRSGAGSAGPPPPAIEAATAPVTRPQPVATAEPEPAVVEPSVVAAIAAPPPAPRTSRLATRRATQPASAAAATPHPVAEASDPQDLARLLETRLREMDAAKAAAQPLPPN